MNTKILYSKVNVSHGYMDSKHETANTYYGDKAHDKALARAEELSTTYRVITIETVEKLLSEGSL